MTERRNISKEDEIRIWGEEGFRVFLSHKSEVKKDAAYLKNQLKFYEISCFVAHEDIKPTLEWQNEIENALFSMDAFVALMTPGFHESNWTDQEVGFAVGRGVPIIPLKLGKDPYGFIGKLQALSCQLYYAPLEIVKILIKQDQMVDAYIKAVKKCRSFDEANRLSEILPSITKLSDHQAENLISAFNENDQVCGSFGFSEDDTQKDGNGLVYHLNRLMSRQYEISDGEIKVKAVL